MQITPAMLEAAIRKATEAGLFPRRSSASELAANREIMYSILQAVLDAAHNETMDAPFVDAGLAVAYTAIERSDQSAG